MSIWAELSNLRAQLASQHNDDSQTDVAVISALMDEITGDRPDGTAAAIEARQYRRTGYTFPRSQALKSVFDKANSDHF